LKEVLFDLKHQLDFFGVKSFISPVVRVVKRLEEHSKERGLQDFVDSFSNVLHQTLSKVLVLSNPDYDLDELEARKGFFWV
jgi:hypothetical protein